MWSGDIADLPHPPNYAPPETKSPRPVQLPPETESPANDVALTHAETTSGSNVASGTVKNTSSGFAMPPACYRLLHDWLETGIVYLLDCLEKQHFTPLLVSRYLLTHVVSCIIRVCGVYSRIFGVFYMGPVGHVGWQKTRLECTASPLLRHTSQGDNAYPSKQ